MNGIWIMMKKWLLLLVIVCLGLGVNAQSDSLLQYLGMSLEDLLKVKVTTVSNKSEMLSEAPATTIVISRNQLMERGYKDLVEVLQELPGIDLSVAYGDDYYKDYWRGHRSTIGSPFLYMIDGVVQNDLYFNYTTSLAATPLSNIDHIEVVYGPASSVYGANAFMGVINVITLKEAGPEVHVNGSLSGSVKGYFWADMGAIQKIGKTKLAFTARYEFGNLNQLIDNNDFYWLKDKFITDKKLWGDFVNNPKLGGSFSSPIENTGVDFRIYHGNLELAAQYYENRTGFGAIYPLDKTAPQSLWVLPLYNIYGRYIYPFSSNFTSTTMFRYRGTDLSNESYDLEGYNLVNNGTDDLVIGGGDVVAPGDSARVVQLQYWQVYNSSYTLTQDFEWNVNDKLTINSGLKFEDKDLQKAYDLNKGAWYFPDSLNSVSDALPQNSNVSLQNANRVNWLDKGVFVQGKYRATEKSIFNLGCRVDKNSVYGISPTLRAGFVHLVGRFGVKLLYGQAYQEPSPRNLFGNWIGSGSNTGLKPEKSQTGEFNISYSQKSSNQQLSIWWVNNTNTIVNITGGAQNLGERNVLGMDYLMQMEIPLWVKTNVQLYYSLILFEEEEKFDALGVKTGEGNIGDLSHHKIHFGFTSYILKNLFVNIKGQYRGKTELVSTNPLKTMPGYFVIDGNLTWNGFFAKGIGLSLKVMNILDTKYYHPGLRDANSGDSGGNWNGRAWEGSGGWYNSLIPQPRRCIVFSLNINV